MIQSNASQKHFIYMGNFLSKSVNNFFKEVQKVFSVSNIEKTYGQCLTTGQHRALQCSKMNIDFENNVALQMGIGLSKAEGKTINYKKLEKAMASLMSFMPPEMIEETQSIATCYASQHQHEKLRAHLIEVANSLLPNEKYFPSKEKIKTEISILSSIKGNEKTLQNELIKVLKPILKQKISNESTQKTIKQVFQEARIDLIHSKEVTVIDTEFYFLDNKYTCKQTPAGIIQGTDAKSTVFCLKQDKKFVSCRAITQTENTRNLWELKVKNKDNKDVFTSIRHAVCSAYGCEDTKKRLDGAETAAKQLLTAALFSQPEKLKCALAGETVPLQVVSTSLLTLTGPEKAMFKDQQEALKKISKKNFIELILFEKNKENKFKKITVKVQPQILSLNFGVNERALILPFKSKANTFSDGKNALALKELLGEEYPKRKIGGWVGEYLQKNPKDTATKGIAEQVIHILKNKLHHNDGGDPYKAPRLIAMLAYNMGCVPCFNCKSGKDRTGKLNAELIRDAVYIHETNEAPPLPDTKGQMNQELSSLGEIASLKDGSAEIQAYNTGAQGNIVFRRFPLPAFIEKHLSLSHNKPRNMNSYIWQSNKGSAQYVKA